MGNCLGRGSRMSRDITSESRKLIQAPVWSLRRLVWVSRALGGHHSSEGEW